MAAKLLTKRLHLVGILDPGRLGNPPAVVSKQLAAGETYAMENSKGITVLKWKEKQQEKVLLLSTKHSFEMMKIECRSSSKRKPLMDYGRGRTAIDLADRMNAYSLTLCKAMKWYRKLGFDLLLNTAVSNAYLLYKDATNEQQVSISEFRKELAVHLTQFCPAETIVPLSIVEPMIGWHQDATLL
uniref:DDE_Tnp_1_7 domain-containing protein n=1 Tax=Anopheles quadriannulatus TaxID=34691 RepID=A0A182X6F0_ANOQN